MNKFIYWTLCPTCGNCLCFLKVVKTKHSEKGVSKITHTYVCKENHKFKIKF